MKPVVVPMVWNLEWLRRHVVWMDRVFELFWRVAIVLLPWQTRWFHEGPMLGGYPWEGGRMSIYLSWVPMITTVVLGWVHRSDGAYRTCRTYTGGVVVFAMVASSLFTSVYWPATGQWWIEVLLLASFVLTLIRRVDRDQVTRWVIYAIIPHAVLGIVQHFTQIVVGSKWLGMSSQHPLIPGVSVVEALGQRWLRAYGGFPHPNILGGWLVAGIAVTVSSIEYQVSSIKRPIRFPFSILDTRYLILTLFSVALVLTFSRSAWAALLVFFVHTAYTLDRSQARRSFFLGALVIITTMGLVLAWRSPIAITRIDPDTRLEQRSLDERAVGFRNGWALFKHHPWFGVGPRATGYALVEEGIVAPGVVPTLPHNVPLLILNEFGLLGILISCLVLFRHLRLFLSPYVFFIFFIPIFLFDHYLFSTWSGLALTALVFFFSQERD